MLLGPNVGECVLESYKFLFWKYKHMHIEIPDEPFRFLINNNNNIAKNSSKGYFIITEKDLVVIIDVEGVFIAKKTAIANMNLG